MMGFLWLTIFMAPCNRSAALPRVLLGPGQLQEQGACEPACAQVGTKVVMRGDEAATCC